MHVLGYKSNEMVAVQLVGSYCLPSLLYGCEVWQTRVSDVRSASVALNNCFQKIFNACWNGRQVSDHCYSFVRIYH